MKLLSKAKQIANYILAPFGQQITSLALSKTVEKISIGLPPFYISSKTCQIRGLTYLYEKFFGCRHEGLFVEVGAFDGESYSNTSCLADAGWQGHYIEPIPEFYASCQKRHARNPHVKVYNIAIGNCEEEIVLHVGGPMTTANLEHLNTFKTLDWAKDEFTINRSVKAQQITLDAFLEKNSMPKGFDLLVVDVEGHESAVFAGFNLPRWRPNMLIVELGDTKSDLAHAHMQYASLQELIVAQDYCVIYKDPINTVFVTRELYRKIHNLDL